MYCQAIGACKACSVLGYERKANTSDEGVYLPIRQCSRPFLFSLLEDTVNRNQMISFRANAVEARRITELAHQTGKSQSELLREMVRSVELRPTSRVEVKESSAVVRQDTPGTASR